MFCCSASWKSKITYAFFLASIEISRDVFLFYSLRFVCLWFLFSSFSLCFHFCWCISPETNHLVLSVSYFLTCLLSSAHLQPYLRAWVDSMAWTEDIFLEKWLCYDIEKRPRMQHMNVIPFYSYIQMKTQTQTHAHIKGRRMALELSNRISNHPIM